VCRPSSAIATKGLAAGCGDTLVLAGLMAFAMTIAVTRFRRTLE